MNISFFNLNKFLISLSLVNAFNYKNSYKIKRELKIVLTFNIRDSEIDTTSVYFPKTLWLLEHITLQKGIIVNLKTKRIGRNQRRVVFCAKTVLRNNKLFNFLYFFLCFIIYGFFRKFLNYNLKIDRLTSDYSFLIKDINIYPGFLEDFFKWFYPLLIQIVFNDYDLILSQHILQDYGINVL